MIKISIIVPVYNTYKYLGKCLESLCNQNIEKKDYEIIVVNDGTLDDSEKIILEYQKKYSKLVKYIKKENGGLSSARNVGIANARGKYLLFIDSDDYVDGNLLSTFLKYNNNYDLFTYGYRLVFEDNDQIVERVTSHGGLYDKKDAVKLFFEDDSVRGYVWNKFFKKAIIVDNNIKFDEEIKYIEDLPFVIEYLSKCNSIYFNSSVMYNYFQRNGSLINSGFNSSKLTSLKAYDKVEQIISKICPEYIYHLYYFMFEVNYELSIRLRISDNYSEFKSEYKMLKSNMRNYVHKTMFKKIGIKYKAKMLVKYFFYWFCVKKHGGENAKN